MTASAPSASSLDAFFRPRSVAVLGASADPRKLGYALVENLIGFEGNVYPISRSSEAILGLPTVPSIRDLPESPDLLLVSIPALGVPDAIGAAVAIGAKAAVILSCGFAEAGTEGASLQERALDLAGLSGLRIIGPNCMGICELHEGLNATYFKDLPGGPGSVGFISQSGAFGGIAFSELYRHGVGISRFASIGNMADVTHAELMRNFAEDECTKVIAAFIEGIRNGPAFFEAVRYASARKPVVILKAGRTEAGGVAALSHTASLAGDGPIWEPLLGSAGAIVVEDSEDLFDAAAVLSRHANRPASGNRLAIVTISGGPSVVAADTCERYGLVLPQLDEGLSSLRDLVPSFASLRNPVDLTAQIQPANYERAVAEVAAHPEVDAVLAINVGLDVAEFGFAFAHAASDGKPIVGYVIAPGIEATFAKAGIPNFASVERAVRAVRRLLDRTRAVKRHASPPRFVFEPADIAPGMVTEYESKRLLAAHGFPVTREEVVRERGGVVSAARRIGFPLALKVAASGVVHKTDIGGVHVGLSDETRLHKAYRDLVAKFPGAPVLVQEFVADGIELILGARRDPLAGPILMVGIGGIAVEVLGDVTFRPAPLTPEDALEAIGELRSQRLLEGHRNAQSVNIGGLAELMERLSALLLANPSIVEIDLNPVIASAGQLTVADAFIRTIER